MRRFSTVELLRDFGTVSRASDRGPVEITQHRKPAYVLMSVEQYEKLTHRGDPRKVFSVAEMPAEDRDALIPYLERIVAEAGLDDA
jgi:prevent-host-death family protein